VLDHGLYVFQLFHQEQQCQDQEFHTSLAELEQVGLYHIHPEQAVVAEMQEDLDLQDVLLLLDHQAVHRHVLCRENGREHAQHPYFSNVFCTIKI